MIPTRTTQLPTETPNIESARASRERGGGKTLSVALLKLVSIGFRPFIEGIFDNFWSARERAKAGVKSDKVKSEKVQKYSKSAGGISQIFYWLKTIFCFSLTDSLISDFFVVV